MNRLTLVVLPFLFVTSFSSVKAQISVVDDPLYGVGSLTRDAAQGLDFLDVPLTSGRSFAEVSEQLGEGGEFEGFRFASEAEVLTLANIVYEPDAVFEAGVSDASVQIGQGPEWGELIENLGVTGPDLHRRGLIGLTSTTLDPAGPLQRIRTVEMWYGIPLAPGEDPQPDLDQINLFFLGGPFLDRLPGAFLVRPVPEPTLSVWYAIPLVLDFFRRRNRSA